MVRFSLLQKRLEKLSFAFKELNTTATEKFITVSGLLEEK
jgi:hypothetical protein